VHGHNDDGTHYGIRVADRVCVQRRPTVHHPSVFRVPVFQIFCLYCDRSVITLRPFARVAGTPLPRARGDGRSIPPPLPFFPFFRFSVSSAVIVLGFSPLHARGVFMPTRPFTAPRSSLLCVVSTSRAVFTSTVYRFLLCKATRRGGLVGVSVRSTTTSAFVASTTPWSRGLLHHPPSPPMTASPLTAYRHGLIAH